MNNLLSYLPYSSGCTKDYVDVYRSLDSSGTLAGHICGAFSRYGFSTTGSEFFIHFHSDGSNTGSDASFITGFSADFQATGTSCVIRVLNTMARKVCMCTYSLTKETKK